jgi:fibronectin type 3 domain-containing protein
MNSRILAMCLGCLLFIFGSTSLKAVTLPNPTSYYVELTWQAPVTPPGGDPAVGYFVFRSQDSGSTYTQLTQAVLAATLYDDNAMSYPAIYLYYVVSVDAQGNISAPSNIVTTNIPFVPYSPVMGKLTN